MSKFFISRPIVAIVISILTVIVGAITIVSLPVSQFPAIAPPEVQVQTVRSIAVVWAKRSPGVALHFPRASVRR